MDEAYAKLFSEDSDVRDIMQAWDALVAAGMIVITSEPDDTPLFHIHDRECVESPHRWDCDCWCHENITDTLLT